MDPFYNAHHSPSGAFASFTFGRKGAEGGLGLELKGPANENLYIGVEDADAPGNYKAFPFFEGAAESNEVEDYDIEGLSDFQFKNAVKVFPDQTISRRMGACCDEWTAEDFTFRVMTPVYRLPDPDNAPETELIEAFAPVVYAELVLDNRQGKADRKVFIGYAGSDRANAMRTWKQDGITGIGQGREVAIATDAEGVYSGIAWQPEAILNPRHEENVNFMLGSLALLVANVPAGEQKTIPICIAFFREGIATSGIEARYLYRRWFERIEEVVWYGLSNFKSAVAKAQDIDSRIDESLTPTRALMASHAIRSYLGSSQALELSDGRPMWVVNEGEYRMMNTFDLTVDQLYMELALNPWTVRNVLDFFVERFSYEDRARFPGQPETYPAGIAFCHDMGVANLFSPPEHSCYEQAGLRGVFSYMSFEELVNWTLCSCLYMSHTNDQKWLLEHRETFGKVLTSMANRDHPDPTQRNGIMGLDSDRCKGGKEITTYDSLDASLGQARNNLYLAVKTWAAYALLEGIFEQLEIPSYREISKMQAQRCADTIISSADEDGLLPAVIGEGIEARIIPAIEGLIFPLVANRPDILESYSDLKVTLAKHFDQILTSGICLFPDGGWKLSSTSRNSWLSKIYLCQFIAESILNKPADHRADNAHLGWLMDKDNSYFAWSDQMLAGKAHGSRYYPRGVTSLLWLAKSEAPVLKEIEAALFL